MYNQENVINIAIKNGAKIPKEIGIWLNSPDEFYQNIANKWLSCDKSFLEALVKARLSRCHRNDSLFNYQTPKEWGTLQYAESGTLIFDLNDGLIHHNGKDFWKICSEFIGEEK